MNAKIIKSSDWVVLKCRDCTFCDTSYESGMCGTAKCLKTNGFVDSGQPPPKWCPLPDYQSSSTKGNKS